MSCICNSCQKPVSWDKAMREKLGIRGPINPYKTAHFCKKTNGDGDGDGQVIGLSQETIAVLDRLVSAIESSILLDTAATDEEKQAIHARIKT